MKKYEVVVTFLEPREGNIKLQANSLEEAEEMANKLLKNRIDGQVVSINEILEKEEENKEDGK